MEGYCSRLITVHYLECDGLLIVVIDTGESFQGLKLDIYGKPVFYSNLAPL